MDAAKKQIYFDAQFRRKPFIFDAVFSDVSRQFVSNPEPALDEAVTVTLRTAVGDSDGVFLVSGEDRHKMELTRSDGLFDYYTVDVTVSGKIKYGFVITYGGRAYFYNKRGVFTDILNHDFDFVIIPDFKTPEWAKGAVMYQIFTDRFFNGDVSNDVVTNEYSYMRRAAKRIENWDEPVAADDIANFYGGDLQGIIDKLDYLKDMGVEVLYLTPIFVSPSNHKYDIQDYDYVDPHIGAIVNDGGEPLVFEKFHNRFATKYMKRTTDKANLEASNKLFERLMGMAHEKDMRVIIDGVFNHCGAFHKWMDRENFYGANGYPPGAYRDAKSPYNHYFRWYDEAWPNNECYDSYWGLENHPKLFYEDSPELYDEIMGVGAKWVSAPYNVDGWRLDVAAYLGYTRDFNHKFWRDFRKNVKEANPDAIILAEHYMEIGDTSEWLNGFEWDSIMNYSAFMEPITWFLTGMQKHSDEFRADLLSNPDAFEGAMRYHSARLPYQSLMTSMNQLSNHDHSRFLTRTNMTVGRLHTAGADKAEKGISVDVMMEAVVFQFAWPGAPCVYYGDEAGLCGWTDPDSRRTYPWGRENAKLIELHKKMIKIHKENDALITGSLEYLILRRGVICFGRWTGDDGGAVICALNNNGNKNGLEIPVWRLGIRDGREIRTLLSTSSPDFASDKTYTVKSGYITVELAPASAVMLSC